MSIQDYRVVEQHDQDVEQAQRAQSNVREKAANEHVTGKQDEAPPTTGSKQWKALYESISKYARELRSNRD